MLHRHPLGPEVAEDSVHASVHDSSGPQRHQFVPGLRSGRHRTVRNILTCDDRRSGRCPTAANGAVFGHFIGQDLGGCPQEWRTEVTQLGTVSDWLKAVDLVITCLPTAVSALNYDRTSNARPYPSVWSNYPRTKST